MDKKVVELNKGWKFHYGECEGAWYKGFREEGFQMVIVPHDWAVQFPFSKEYSSGTGYLLGGISWYRLHFLIPNEYKGKHIQIVFDGVYNNSKVWVNSYYMGKHPNGYTSFFYDITDLVSSGEEENVISVKVSHTDIADSRWYTGSGITRKVWLVIEEPIHSVIDGTYCATEKIMDNYAHICIHHEIENSLPHNQKVDVTARLVDTQGKIVIETTTEIELQKESRKQIKLQEMIENPILWSVEHPYLYELQIYYTVGEVYLADTQPVGIRLPRFDSKNGFFLNGEQLTIKGVCLHHDAGCLGAAVTKEVWHRRLETLKECGCNAIRCSHNPHMPELYELCDEMGFLVMDEAFDEWENAKNKWSTGHNVYPPKHQGYFEDFPEWHERDLKAMVRRDRKHPSVIMWSIGNEIDYPNDPYCHESFLSMTGNNDANKPAAERIYDKNKPDAKRMIVIAKKLSNMVRQEDNSRPVTMALAFPELSMKLGIYDTLDVVGYNYKEQFYECDHMIYSNIPIFGSENGHNYEAWKAVTEHNYMSGQFLWTGIDFLGEAYGWPIHGSAAGILDMAGYKKHRFYRRKSYWLEESVLEVATRIMKEECDNQSVEWIPCNPSWNYREGEKVLVMCYSNLAEIRLYINDKEVGRQREYNYEGSYGFVVNYVSGILRADGYDLEGNFVKTVSLETTGPAAEMKIELWKEKETPTNHQYNNPSEQIGYLYQLEVSLFDENHKQVTSDDKTIRVDTEGAGCLAGIENGNLSDNTPYSIAERKTNAGRLIVYIKRADYGAIKAVLWMKDCAEKKVEIAME